MNYTLNMQDLGQRLEGVIKTRGVSKASVARETGLTPAIITGLCRGTRKSVRAETLGRLGVALKVSTDYLLGITNDLQPSAATQSSNAPQETKPTKRRRPRKAAPVA
jgi:transcriptional regulator with XRE-family HTH domain